MRCVFRIRREKDRVNEIQRTVRYGNWFFNLSLIEEISKTREPHDIVR